MRYLAIFFFSYLAAMAAADNCTKYHEVDLSSILVEYENSVNELPVPILETNDHSARNFRDLISKAVRVYGLELFDGINRQAIEVGEKLVSAVQSAHQKLQQSIESVASHKSEPDELDNDLKELTNRLETVLKLDPGKSQVPSPILPPIFEQPIDLVPRTTKRTAEELFIDGEITMNSLGTNFFAYAITLFRVGWACSRQNYRIFISQLRDEVLNDRVLPASREVVKKVDKQGDLVRRNVLPETWKCYKNAGHRILAAYDFYTASQDRDC